MASTRRCAFAVALVLALSAVQFAHADMPDLDDAPMNDATSQDDAAYSFRSTSEQVGSSQSGPFPATTMDEASSMSQSLSDSVSQSLSQGSSSLSADEMGTKGSTNAIPLVESGISSSPATGSNSMPVGASMSAGNSNVVIGSQGSNGKQDAKIVRSLPRSVKYIDGPNKQQGADAFATQIAGVANDFDSKDPAVITLRQALKDTLQKIQNEKHWIEDVTAVMAHYKEKIASVKAGLRTRAADAVRLKKLLKRQHKINARKVLAEKLNAVTQQMSGLKTEATGVTGEAAKLLKMKADLQRGITSIQRQIEAFGAATAN